MTNRPYQICGRCIMDTSDPDIVFDEKGVCHYCVRFEKVFKPMWFPNEEGRQRLETIVRRIKEQEKASDYDCIIGLSGGVDSSYLAYKASQLGMRMLAVHVDGGWNSELAVKNIENIVKRLGLDLYTWVVDWDEMKDLQVAFLRAGVANADIPQDHTFFAALYAYARKKGIRNVLSGSNLATEAILPPAWGYDAMDLRHIMAIHRRFGTLKLKTYPRMSFFQQYVYYPRIFGMKVVRPLNYMPYDKDSAIQVLEKEIGFRYYGAKHCESRFTKFFQSYYLVEKFGYDKRRAHLASLVTTGQMSREDALREMEKPTYSPDELKEDRMFVIKKLGLSDEEFESIMRQPNKTYLDYPSRAGIFNTARKVKRMLKT